jgi:Rrf2 family protein
MLKISNRGLYGIKALYELSRRFGGEPLTIREISDLQNLPVPFLEQVLNKLKREGLVEGRRGVNGGYVLARDPRDITIGDAVRALEGPIMLCDCSNHLDLKTIRRRAKTCVTSGMNLKLSRVIEEAFDSMTIYELHSGENSQKYCSSSAKEE